MPVDIKKNLCSRQTGAFPGSAPEYFNLHYINFRDQKS